MEEKQSSKIWSDTSDTNSPPPPNSSLTPPPPLPPPPPTSSLTPPPPLPPPPPTSSLTPPPPLPPPPPTSSLPPPPPLPPPPTSSLIPPPPLPPPPTGSLLPPPPPPPLPLPGPPLLLPPTLIRNFNMAAEAPSSSGATSAALPGRGDGEGKKRRRPRKYDPEGKKIVQPQTTSYLSDPHETFSSSNKKARENLLDSAQTQNLTSSVELFASTAGDVFTPHMLTLNTGENIVEKILSFVKHGPRGVCVLSANGSVSNVIIRQPGTSIIYAMQGNFNILCLTGSFTIFDNIGTRTGAMSVSLAGPNGHIFGGDVAGFLTAASPIQLVIGTFNPNIYIAQKTTHQHERTLTTSTATPSTHEPVTTATPTSQITPEQGVPVNPAFVLALSGYNHKEASQATKSINTETEASNATPSLTSNSNGSKTAPSQRP